MEDGVTLKRMRAAVKIVEDYQRSGKLTSMDPHALVDTLRVWAGKYTTEPNKNGPADHPWYVSGPQGAWLFVDYKDLKANCQAMVRLIRGILHQLGVPGKAEPVVVWADPFEEHGKTAIEGLLRVAPPDGERPASLLVLDPETGMLKPNLHSYMPENFKGVPQELQPADLKELYFDAAAPSLRLVTIRDHSREALPEGKWKRCWPILVAKPPVVGKAYLDVEEFGRNFYEACLKFTYPEGSPRQSATQYYGGGAGKFSSSQDVLRAFDGLVVYTSEKITRDGKDQWVFRIVDILADYRQP
jgi:hypothetical protein